MALIGAAGTKFARFFMPMLPYRVGWPADLHSLWHGQSLAKWGKMGYDRQSLR